MNALGVCWTERLGLPTVVCEWEKEKKQKRRGQGGVGWQESEDRAKGRFGGKSINQARRR